MLARKIDETLHIDLSEFGLAPIIVQVVGLGDSKVRLGITADPRIGIWRSEVIDGSRDARRDGH